MSAIQRPEFPMADTFVFKSSLRHDEFCTSNTIHTRTNETFGVESFSKSDVRICYGNHAFCSTRHILVPVPSQDLVFQTSFVWVSFFVFSELR